jgi:hypothetical protein
VLGECGAGDQILLVWIQAVDGDRSRIGAGPVRGVDNAAEAAFLVVRGIVRGVLERHDGACSGDDIVGNPVAVVGVDGGVVDRVVGSADATISLAMTYPKRLAEPGIDGSAVLYAVIGASTAGLTVQMLYWTFSSTVPAFSATGTVNQAVSMMLLPTANE